MRRGSAADLLVVGLGNPGPEFAGSRHNAGADTVTELASRYPGTKFKRVTRLRSSVAEVRTGDRLLALAIPTTFMNDSGGAVAPLVRRFRLAELSRLVVVHDELDLVPGRMRIKMGGGTAGHNGLRSISARLGSGEFARIRIGIGKPPDPQAGADHVLRRPSAHDRRLIEQAVVGAADAVELIFADGIQAAMNRYNSIE